ncbi:MAG: CYTH domain-containing protein [Desulfobacterales bacterium]|nr:CYTH domain-containing protein [Desulfobacterales bacterium]
MAKEIERKFLVEEMDWRGMGEETRMRQGYLPTSGRTVARVRVAGGGAFLTIKGETKGATRTEFEYPIPVTDADEMLETLCRRPVIEKTRYRIEHGGLVWEVDVFEGENQGLTVAEVELEDESQEIDPPPWITTEVTHDPRYFNSNLASHPFSQWEKNG